MSKSDRIIYSLGVAGLIIISIFIFDNSLILSNMLIMWGIFFVFTISIFFIIHIIVSKIKKIPNVYDFVFLIIVSIVTSPFLNIQETWSSILLSIAISSFFITFFKTYNKKLIKENNEKIIEDFAINMNKAVPIGDLIFKETNFLKLGEKIQNMNDGNLNEIVEIILGDQANNIDKKKFIISLESYLKILNRFRENSKSLYCVNKTLPIFWFSPAPSERKFVLNYASSVKSSLDIFRITVIDNVEQVNKQFEIAEKDIRNKWNVKKNEYLIWIFILFSSLINDENDIIIDTLRTKNFDIYNKYFNPVFIRYLGNEDKIQNACFVEDFLNNLDDSNSELLYNFITEKILVNNEFYKEINKKINYSFYEITGENGSLFAMRKYLSNLFKREGFVYDKFGELGVFFNSNDKPLLSFATIGDFTNIIEIQILEQDTLATAIKNVYSIISVNTIPDLYGRFQ